MNCFLGLEARPGALSKRRSKPACIVGGMPGGKRAAAVAAEGNVKLPAAVGDGPGPVKYGGGYITEAGTPGGGTWPGRGISIAAATAASLKANSLRLSAIMAIISKLEPLLLGSLLPSTPLAVSKFVLRPVEELRSELLTLTPVTAVAVCLKCSKRGSWATHALCSLNKFDSVGILSVTYHILQGIKLLSLSNRMKIHQGWRGKEHFANMMSSYHAVTKF
uniref:Uncharacterized protein n=1 Tax=Glossina austeni TaxID=7395 RepID=A0A1A9VF03_GLOAU